MGKKILFVDSRKEIIQDLEANFVLYSMGSDFDLRCLCSGKPEDVDGMVARYEPDRIVLGCNVLNTRDSWDYPNAETVFYARRKNELQENAGCGLKTIGIAAKATEILKKIDGRPFFPERAEKKDPPEAAGNLEERSKPEDKTGTGRTAPKPDDQQKDKRAQKHDPVAMNKAGSPAKVPVKQEKKDADNKKKALSDILGLDGGGEDLEVLPDSEQLELDRIFKQKDVEDTVLDAHEKQDPQEDVVEKGFQQDLRGNKRKTKVITVYSAKGGVGKTTISSELAECLALVQDGNRRLRAAIVDYNVDFGDVRATLAADPEGANVTYWAAEVKELLDSGQKQEDIQFSREEIEEHMQKDPKSGLFILPAPLTNEDSMELTSESLEVILDNIINNSLNEEILAFLKLCVLGHVSIYVSGGTGTGKTTFLNMLSAFIPKNELLITIEDTLELQLKQPNVRALQTRDIQGNDQKSIDMADLVKASLRMRPDRIIVGETRDAAVISLLEAMSTGHEGSMSTGHANDPENLCNVRIPLMIGKDKAAIFSERTQALMISEALQVIVQLKRLSNGRRVVSQVCEVGGLNEDGKVAIHNIYVYDQEKDEFVYTGYKPERSIRQISTYGLEFSDALFQ